jgi:RND family efflux transporter MFP subunit
MKQLAAIRVLLVLTVTVLGLSLPAQARQAPPATVAIGEADERVMSPTMNVSGTVVSRSDAVLSTEVEGRLVQVADVGSRVEEDAVLAEIEDVALKLREQELVSEVRRAQSRLEFLNLELRRLETLSEQGLTSATELDRTRSERDVAASDRAVAENRLAQVRHQLERTRIRAPFPGVVAERLAQAGERVATGTPVLRLLNPEHLEIIARAPLSYFAFQQQGGTLDFTTGNSSYQATLRTLVAVGSENSHVFELRLDLDTPLPVGQTVRVSIPTADAREVLTVPRDALVLRSDGVAVFVINEDNTVRRVRVTAGTGSGDRIEVRGPIQPGDRVVIRGAERLRDGQTVAPQG